MNTSIKKAKPKLAKPPRRKPSPVAIGIDLSPSSLAVCARGYDATLGREYGPVWTVKRWYRDAIHWDKLKEVSRAENFIHDILVKLNGGFAELDDIYIGVEELPPRVMNASRYREQAELIGSLVGGLLRYGYVHVDSVNIKKWHKIVADDLGISTAKIDKWIVKQWCIDTYDAPKWKDLIRTKDGLRTKPKTSKAKPAQPADQYDATGIAEYIWEKYVRVRT